MAQRAFVLPGGFYLAYGFPWTKGNQREWRNFNITPTFTKKLSSSDKRDCVKLGCWSSDRNTYYDRHIIIMADFDHLFLGLDDYDSLASILKMRYKKKGLVIRSFSGKVKIAFVVKVPKKTILTYEDALETLKSLVFAPEWEALDKTLGALSVHFTTLAGHEELKNGLQTVQVHEYVQKTKPIHVYRSYTGELPTFIQHFVNKDARKEKFVRILLETKRLAYDGFDLPIKKLAKECDVDIKTVSNWLKCLRNIGLLVCIDHSYVIGKKAKTYRSIGALTSFLIPLGKIVKREYGEIPTSILDGKWYKTLYYVAKTLQTASKYEEWYQNIPNNDKKDRKRMFLNNLKRLKGERNAG